MIHRHPHPRMEPYWLVAPVYGTGTLTHSQPCGRTYAALAYGGHMRPERVRMSPTSHTHKPMAASGPVGGLFGGVERDHALDLFPAYGPFPHAAY